MKLTQFGNAARFSEKLSAPLDKLGMIVRRLSNRGYHADSQVINRYVDQLTLQKDFVRTNKVFGLEALSEHAAFTFKQTLVKDPKAMRIREEAIAVLGKYSRGELAAPTRQKAANAPLLRHDILPHSGLVRGFGDQGGRDFLTEPF